MADFKGWTIDGAEVAIDVASASSIVIEQCSETESNIASVSLRNGTVLRFVESEARALLAAVIARKIFRQFEG